MTATARVIEITDEDIESAGGSGGGAYAALVVPADYVALLKDISDYDNREKGGTVGWKFHYVVEGLKFDETIALSKAARWKLIDTFEAHGFPIESGKMSIDPNVLLNTEVGAHIDFPPAYYKATPEEQATGKWYREIRYVFALAPDEAPEEIFGGDEPVASPAGLSAEEPETF